MARYYAKHETPPLMQPIIMQGRLARVDKILQMATQEITKARQAKEVRLAQAKERYMHPTTPKAHSMSVGQRSIVIADVHRINAIPIADLIKILENVVQEYKEGSYRMLKTATAKYSITENNIAYDFKSGEKYGVYAYLARQFSTSVWNNIARKLGKRLGCSFLMLDPAFGDVLRNAIAGAHSRQEVERTLKAHYGV
ncbi:hypothetical protein [Helicobacter sp. L8]|uniref:hypothetical protein n=1 Tax=Helicobacter sp. L8 TaxID=2316078 RepID=UPI001F08CB21|nr:hypothetical protein [Helicobacter sp. L8]